MFYLSANLETFIGKEMCQLQQLWSYERNCKRSFFFFFIELRYWLQLVAWSALLIADHLLIAAKSNCRLSDSLEFLAFSISSLQVCFACLSIAFASKLTTRSRGNSGKEMEVSLWEALRQLRELPTFIMLRVSCFYSIPSVYIRR